LIFIVIDSIFKKSKKDTNYFFCPVQINNDKEIPFPIDNSKKSKTINKKAQQKPNKGDVFYVNFLYLGSRHII
jgi:hypothetical protein